MMNLHNLVRQAVTGVNPDQTVILLQSDGQTVVNYKQVAAWKPAVEVKAQVQPTADKAITWLYQSRQNAIWRDCYLYGEVNGLSRAAATGGDLLYFEGFEWQVDQVLEAWSATCDWTKVRVIQLRKCEPPEVGSAERPAGGM